MILYNLYRIGRGFMKKNKNGFTLVELLVVIVVLALIMIITIPAVLDVMEDARKNSFVLYCQKVVKDTQTQYVYDSNLGNAGGAGLYVYDITSDLGYSSTGNYRGYVVVDATSSSGTKYWLFLYDNNYAVAAWNVSEKGDPTTSNLQNYSAQLYADNFKSPVTACRKAKSDTSFQCQNRNGYIISN